MSYSRRIERPFLALFLLAITLLALVLVLVADIGFREDCNTLCGQHAAFVEGGSNARIKCFCDENGEWKLKKVW